MQTIIYLVRHGQVYNPDKIIYGRLPNFGLSETGKKQIEETAEFLKDKQVDIIFSSPLLRAKQTAEIIKDRLELPTIHITEEINEVKTSYQGWKESDLDKLQSEVYLKPLDSHDETMEQIAQRMKHFVETISQSFAGKHIAVCSHGDPIMLLKFAIQHKPFEVTSFKKDNYVQHGEVYQITINEEALSIMNVFKPTFHTLH